ncbi:MAG: hypothetical protein U9N76_04685 [Candidatus Marinimicrobia bacterium]|nr:hypothetical protein [Candidatus Neomarinimicrobiota bacterium]
MNHKEQKETQVKIRFLSMKIKNKIRRVIKVIFVIVFLPIILMSQNWSIGEQRNEYEKAIKLEKENELKKAQDIYDELFNYQIKNFSYYRHLKNVLSKQKKYDDLIIVIEKWKTETKLNQNEKIELGALYFKQKNIDKAKHIWKLSLKKGRDKRQVADLIFRYSLKYNLSNQLNEIVDFVRDVTDDKNILLIQNVEYFIARQKWNELILEIVFHLNNGGVEINKIKYQLYKIKNREKIFKILIPKLSDYKNDKTIGTDVRLLLSNLYLNIGQSEKAVNILITSPEISKKILSETRLLAQQLFDIHQYKYSIIANNYFLENSKDSKMISKTLLLIGKSYEMSYRQKTVLINLVHSPFENYFTNIEFKNYSLKNNNQLQKAISIYDSISTNSQMLDLKSESFFQIGEIRYNIFNDFDNALDDYLKSLKNSKQNKKVATLNRIIDIYIAKGDKKSAIDFLEKAPMKYMLTVKEEDELMLKKLQIDYLFGNIDSLENDINISLSLINESHKLYNDLLNFRFMIKSLQATPTITTNFLLAERYIQQNKMVDARLLLEKILAKNSEINPIVAIRYISVLRILSEVEMENKFWNNYKKKLLETKYGDYFSIKYAEYYEYYLNNKKKSENIYTDFLMNYSDSPYFNMVRLHLRKLINNRKN